MLDFYYVLARINMVIFIVLFFMLMNKRGYAYNIKTNIRFILILILLIALIKDGMPFGVVVLQILIIIISILSLICKITYKIDMKESIINSLMYSLFYILIECSIYWILQCSLKYEAIHMIILDIAINFIIIFIGIYFFDRLQKIYNDKKYYICIILTIPVNVVIILFLNISDEKIGDLYSIVVKNNMEYTHLLDTIVISGFMQSTFPYILFIINIILISIFINSIKSEKEKAKREIVNEKLDMQYKYYLMVKESQEKMKQVYHDMNNHMENIRSLKNSSEDVNEYINNIEDEVKNNKNIYNTGNALLDIILYEKSKDCIKNNIDFNVGIDFSKCEFIDMIDISSIFSNLIDNAIEACNKIDNNKI